MEIKITKTLSKRLEVTNVSAEGEYSVKAAVNVSEDSTVNSVSNGQVTLDGVQKASFNQYGTNNKSVNFICDSSEESAVLEVINSFIGALDNVEF